jgi:hypothetical protein
MEVHASVPVSASCLVGIHINSMRVLYFPQGYRLGLCTLGSCNVNISVGLKYCKSRYSDIYMPCSTAERVSSSNAESFRP